MKGKILTLLFLLTGFMSFSQRKIESGANNKASSYGSTRSNTQTLKEDKNSNDQDEKIINSSDNVKLLTGESEFFFKKLVNKAKSVIYLNGKFYVFVGSQKAWDDYLKYLKENATKGKSQLNFGNLSTEEKKEWEIIGCCIAVSLNLKTFAEKDAEGLRFQ